MSDSKFKMADQNAKTYFNIKNKKKKNIKNKKIKKH